MKNHFYITTTLPYVNAQPHIGFAMEIIRADAWARFWRFQGKEVFFNTGTDEHGQKVYQKAKELGIDVQEYCNQQARKFLKLKEVLNLSFDNFIRTTDEHHIRAAQEFWKICRENGYIYKKNYKIKYCVGCELEKTDSELADGRCLLHPNQELEIIEEENYFFKFSEFKIRLLDFYEKNPDFVQPEKRFREVKKFIEMGLQDFSISRLKEKMPWGVSVPDDDTQVMYVWFDALINYISAIGWPSKQKKFKTFWPGTQICGKDNLRQQSAMWQAMLMAVGLPNSKKIYVNGFINVDGQKMSKSLGNVISPEEMVWRYGVDGTRYLLLSMGTFGEDLDVTWEKLDEKYNADLANGLGNLVSRVVALYKKIDEDFKLKTYKEVFSENSIEFVDAMKIEKVLEKDIWFFLKLADKYIEANKPWEKVKSEYFDFKADIRYLVEEINKISIKLRPFMPETSEKIKQALETKEARPLFQRIK